MTLSLRALLLGFGVSASVAIWLSASGMALWAAGLVAWIGGNVLALAFTAVGAALWPAAPARRSSFTATDVEFRLWDDDLARELINAELMHDPVPATAAATAGQGVGLRDAG